MKDIKLQIEITVGETYLVGGVKENEDAYSTEITIACHGDENYDYDNACIIDPHNLSQRVLIDDYRYEVEFVLYFLDGVCDDTDRFYSDYTELEWEYSLFNE